MNSTGPFHIPVCRNTVSRSAIFCAVATTIERCKTEGVVDVFQVVKAMRAQKPGAIQTLVRMGDVYCINFMYFLLLQEQYHSIFAGILVFVDSFETYSNFSS